MPSCGDEIITDLFQEHSGNNGRKLQRSLSHEPCRTSFRLQDDQVSRKGNHFPIAIVGIGCRMPGNVNSPEEFWDVVKNGRDVLREIPPDRWSLDAYYNPDPTSLGTHVNKRAGFIENIDHFDNVFFKISPKEAAMMDPQQRHLLEVTYEAFEDAAIQPDTLEDKCGVYVGIGMIDYPLMIGGERQYLNPYLHTGVAHSVAANRISFAFNLSGPSVAVDTACASSMTALHFGCQALWNEECSVSVVAGSNVLLMPEVTVGFSALSVLSPDGQSRPFDANAKGYVRSEGFGAIIIKPLSQAILDGDNIYCTILGSGIAANGACHSITMPSCDAQRRLMLSVYEQFNLDAKKLVYVEAHGTGTPVGDPIEAKAIGTALAAGRKIPLKIGSAKSNFGHMECSAGITSIIKSALMLKKRELCPSINFETPVDRKLKDWNIVVQQKNEPFPPGNKHLIGVNNYGFGGALAHAVLSTNNVTSLKRTGLSGWSFGPKEEKGKNLLIPLSAKSEEALYALAKAWMSFESDKDAEGIIGWLSTRRPHYNHRLAVYADSGKMFREKLKTFLLNSSESSVLNGTISNNPEKPRICFVFPGQGQQDYSMGRYLYAREKVFQSTITKCDRIYAKLSGESLIHSSGMFIKDNSAQEHTKSVDDIDVSQPSILFMQLGLIRLLKHWGIYPDMVIGHSFGELAAAFSAGLLSLKEAIEIVFHRCKLQKTLQGTGAMAALRMNKTDASKMCGKHDSLQIACINSPTSVTIAGKGSQIISFVQENVTVAKQLRVQCAFHTDNMDQIESKFLEAIEGRQMIRQAKIPFYSSVTGKRCDDILRAHYWWDNIRQPVNFLDALTHLLNEQAVDIVIECSSAATLLSCVKQTASHLGKNIPVLVNASLRGKNDRLTMLKALGMLYINNVPVNWDNITNNKTEWASLPKYPWQHKPFWCESDFSKTKRLGLQDTTFKSHNGMISITSFPYLKDHVIQEKIIFPGAGYLEYAAECFVKPETKIKMKKIRFNQVLQLGCVLTGNNSKVEEVKLECSKQGEKVTVRGPKAEHASCSVVNSSWSTRPSNINLEVLKTGKSEMQQDVIYEKFSQQGLHYGPAFQAISKAWLSYGQSLCCLYPAKDKFQRFQVATLDGCFQAALLGYGFGNGIFLPAAIEELEMFQEYMPLNTVLYAFAEVVDVTPSEIVADIHLLTEKNKIVLVIRGFCAKNVDITRMKDISSHVYLKDFQPISAVLPEIQNVSKKLTWQHLQETFPNDTTNLLKVASHATLLSKIGSTFAKNALHATKKDDVQPSLIRYYECLVEMAMKEPDAIDDMESAFDQLQESIPDLETELRLFKTLGSMLPQALKTPKAAIDVLFASNGLAEYFSDSLTTRMFYKMVRDIILEGVSKALTEKRVVRVLEIGGRMGGLAKVVLPVLKEVLKEGRVEYIFSDLTQTFFLHARQTLEEYPEVHFQMLDIEQNIQEQGFTPESCDIVICMDTLHSVVSVKEGLCNMKRLLCPGGWLLLLEATKAYNMREIIFGTLELCWVYQDFRQKTCWLRQDEWMHLFQSNGFDDIVAGPKPDIFHSIIMGRKSDESNSLNVKKEIPNKNMAIIFSANNDEGTITLMQNLSCNIERTTFVSNLVSCEQHLKMNKCELYCILEESDDCLNTLFCVMKLACLNRRNITKVWIISMQGTVIAYPNSEMICGFTRATRNEFRDLPVYSVTLNRSEHIRNITVLQNLISKPGLIEREFFIREGQICIPRISRVSLSNSEEANHVQWYLAAREMSVIDNIVFFQQHSQPLLPNDVRIRVKSAALNFKDVMCAMGMLSDFATADALGLECSGIIDEVGSNVTEFKAGDEVFGLGHRCLASHVTLSQHFVCRKPKDIGFVEAAGLGIVFSTAYEALVEKGRLSADETVLIHSAAGGVGQAAIQIAKMIGSKIICTAGTHEKRKYLKYACGIECVADSRSTQFHDEVMKWTNGKGIDVILNSLSGDKLKAGLSLLADGGRFCEIGKRDILQDTVLSSLVLLENKSFLSVQVDLLMKSMPLRVKRLLETVGELLKNHQIQPTKTTSYDIKDFRNAFAFMKSGDHIGKLVIKINEDFIPPQLERSLVHFHHNASYLVTGGTGGLGLGLLRWMAQRGAKHIAVMSRQGFHTLDQRCTQTYLQNNGVSLRSINVDLASLNNVTGLLENIELQTGQPLKGVFHLAGVIEDGAVAKLSKTKLQRVLDTKAKSAFNLHIATADKNLDYFVLFSSAVSLFGNIDQSAYTCANSYLESLAQQRHQMGLPGLAIQLGAVSGAGLVKRNKFLGEILKARGLLDLHADDILSHFDKILQQSDRSVIAVCNMDWNVLQNHVYEGSNLFASLVKDRHSFQKESEAKVCRGEIEQCVRRKLACMLEMEESDIDIGKPMIEYGVDSLMAVEMVNWLNKELGVAVSQLDILGGVATSLLLEKAVQGSVVLSA